MLLINKIYIKRFRSINDLSLEIDNTHNIITICGQNNVGKTNVLRAISLFFNKSHFVFEEDVPEYKQMTRGASIYPHLKFQIYDAKTKDTYIIDKDYNVKNLDEESNKQYSIKGTKNGIELTEVFCESFLDNVNVFYLPSINISFPETINYLIDDKFLDVEFGKSRMRGKKKSVKDSLEKARSTLQKILDDLTISIDPIFKEFHSNWGIKFVVPKNINRFREILNDEIDFVLTDDTNSEIKSKGAGLQRLGHILINLRIIEKLLEKKNNCILIIDEPDIYLHASLQKKLAKRFKDISNSVQIFITTHSPLFIDGYKLKNIFLLKLLVTSKHSTRKNQLGNILETQLIDLQSSDAVYLIKETLGIEDKDQLLIGRKNLVVEGKEDKHYITELASFFNLPLCNIIETGGVTKYHKYLEFYDSLSESESDKPKFIILYDNDEAGRNEYEKLKKKKYQNIDTTHFLVIDYQNSTYPNSTSSSAKNSKPNIEIEDLIYPEIILELTNKILLKKEGFNLINESEFSKRINNKSMRYNGILEILEVLKNESNPDNGLNLCTKDISFKGGLSKLFEIKGNQEMISKITELDLKYPEVKKFLTKLLK